MTKPFALALALAVATPACGEVVALDDGTDGTSDSAPVVESDEEGVVANLHEYPEFLVSDGDRLYWAGDTFFYEAMTLRSCRKVDCARSVITYATARHIAWLEVSAGEVYFRPFVDDLNLDGTSVLACPTTGCTGDPRVVVEATEAFTIAGDSIFFGSSAAEPPGIYQKPLWGGDATLVVQVQTPLIRMLVHDDQLVWWTTEHVLQRTSLSGEPRIETLFDDSRENIRGLSLTSDRDAVYWSILDLASDIKRCPLVGCPAGPEVVAAPVRMPSSVLASDGRFYLNVELESSEVGLVTCAPFDCANPKLLGVDMDRGTSTIAADERFVYAFSHQGFRWEIQSLPTDHAGTTSGIPLSSLRRYEK